MVKKDNSVILKVQSDNIKKDKTTAEKIADIIARELQSPTKLKVIGQWILVETVEIKPKETTKAGIILPSGENSQDNKKELYWEENPAQGVVIGVGKLELEKGEIKPLDYVYLAKDPRNAIMHNGKWYALVIGLDIATVIG